MKINFIDIIKIEDEGSFSHIQNLIKVEYTHYTMNSTQNNRKLRTNSSQCYPAPMNYKLKANLVK